MKKRDISHWIKNQYLEGLLLFAQSLEESLFHYSYESYKLPALNAHFLCYDILKTADDINSKILMDGNFVPLSEEFEQTVREDDFIKGNISNHNSLFFVKDKNGNYYDLSESDLKAKIKHYPEIAEFIMDICETKNTFILTLLSLLEKNIFVDKFSYDNSAIVYRLARMLISDLVNGGYSKEYLYSTVMDFFFNPHKPIECSIDTVVSFLNCFTFERFNYQVVFGINKKASFMFKKLDSTEVRNPTPAERRILNLQKTDDMVAVIEAESIDEYSVFETAFHHMDTILALHRINQHDSKFYITPKAIVAKKLEDNSFEVKHKISSSVNPMKKKGNSPDLHAIYDDITLMNEIDPPSSFFRSIALHNEAIESKDVSNQLLNLWTIIEVLIDTKRDNEDKINTICTVLGSILNRCYMYSQIEQLLQDVISCTNCDINSLLSKVSAYGKDFDSVERLALILSVDDYGQELKEILNSLEDFPLLQYRIKFFSTQILVDSQSIFNYLQRHEKRIRWHIMRIYRNRNMIVHNGSYMPYRNIILENLHYYVDILLDTLIEYYHVGLLNHSSIYSNIINEETEYYVKLGIALKKGKQRQEIIPIANDNALDLIFNGYSGNMVKKAINRIIQSAHDGNTQVQPVTQNSLAVEKC